jgi:potassium channel subfamily K, other eukaryote
VQIRDVRAVRGDDANILSIWRGLNQDSARGSEHPSTIGKLAKVRQYRNTFAEILVIGSILQRLEGEELNLFERWKEREAQQILQEKELQETMKGEDLERIADAQFDGITSKVFRQNLRRIKQSKLSCISNV